MGTTMQKVVALGATVAVSGGPLMLGANRERGWRVGLEEGTRFGSPGIIGMFSR